MVKKLVLTLIVVALVVAGGIAWRLKKTDRSGEMLLSKTGDSLWLEVGQKKISMISLNLEGVKSLQVNKEVFNSEILNKVITDGRLNVVLGVMKSTAELPSGKILIGKMEGKVITAEGIVTVVGDDKNGPVEVIIEKGKI